MTDLVTGAALSDYLALLHGYFPDELCDRLVAYFEEQTAGHEAIQGSTTPLFTQVDFTRTVKSTNRWGSFHQEVVDGFQRAIDFYMAHVPAAKDFLPVAHMGWESIRLKRYRPGTDEQFPDHVDVVDHATARRALGFFCYLNDVEEGGATSFPHLDVSVQPKKGSILIFPPMWMYGHNAAPVVSGNKYLCQSYLHYS